MKLRKMIDDKKIQVGSPINFRGLIYSPINEQGVVYLFGLIAEDLNMRVESVQQGCPDCTVIQFLGKGRWERINIEFEYKSNNFITHGHKTKDVDMIVCWEDDLKEVDKEKLKKEGIEIKELESLIGTPEIPNKELPDPELVSKKEFDINYHYQRKNVDKKVETLFKKLDKGIKEIDDKIWDKYSKTAITYYSPKKNFVYLKFRKSLIVLHIYTNQKNIEGVKNINFHENWGIIRLKDESDLQKVLNAIRKSYEQIIEAINKEINTGWYARTPKEKLTWMNKDENAEDDE
jgi:predicted transport protein